MASTATYDFSTQTFDFTTGVDVLPYGTYMVKETVLPTGYKWGGTVEQEFTIRTDGTMVKLTTSSTGILNKVIRGGLSVQKIDYMLGRSANHGDADLSGAEFTIVNASANSCVNSSGKEIASSGLSGTVTYAQVLAKASTSTMEVIMSNTSGFAETAKDALPYGTYYVIETSPTHSEDPAVEQISVFLKKMAYLRWQG